MNSSTVDEDWQIESSGFDTSELIQCAALDPACLHSSCSLVRVNHVGSSEEILPIWLTLSKPYLTPVRDSMNPQERGFAYFYRNGAVIYKVEPASGTWR